MTHRFGLAMARGEKAGEASRKLETADAADSPERRPEKPDLPDDSGRKPYQSELPEDSGEKPRSAELPEDSGKETPPSETGKTEKTGEEIQRRKEKIDGVWHYYDDNGKLYRIGDGLLPNNTYEINRYRYQTDSLGRIVSASGTLRIKEREGRRNMEDPISTIGKGDQREGDQRGHLIGDQFDGSSGLENMIPQDAYINENDFKRFETLVLAAAVKDGRDVRVEVIPMYEGDSRRPAEIAVVYSIDGKTDSRIFPNSKEDI